MVLGLLTGWLERRERQAIAYLIVENRLLRRQLGPRRLHLTDDDRRRLAARAYRVGRAALAEIATIATPDTWLRWHRQLIARKWTYAGLHLLGSTPHPSELLMGPVVRMMTAADGVRGGHRVLICDRDRKWSRAVRRRFDEAGIRVVLTPERAPNAYAERFVRSIKKNVWIK